MMIYDDLLISFFFFFGDICSYNLCIGPILAVQTFHHQGAGAPGVNIFFRKYFADGWFR